MGAKAVVLGASGFTGAELVRLVHIHPALDAVGLSGDRNAGRALKEVHPHLPGVEIELGEVADVAAIEGDVCFSCLPSGSLQGLLDVIRCEVVVDLSDSFRGDGGWVYGLTELARTRLHGATRIANPGCYPTATLLGLAPFARAGLVEGPVIVDALSGVSGAGRKNDDDLAFTAMFGTARAYGSLPHRHVPEMERVLSDLAGRAIAVSFTPHLVPMARGLLATIRTPIALASDHEALEVLSSAYQDEPFVDVIEQWPTTKAVTASNRAVMTARVDARLGLLICSVAIDNLGKGAAGQAVQNANVALGLSETAGLESTGVWP